MPKSAVMETYQYLSGSLGRRATTGSPDVGRRVRDTLVPRRTRETFIALVRLAADRGLTAGTLTEASQRLDADKFIITARDTWAANVEEDDLKVTAMHDRWVVDLEEMPRHMAWHRLIYRETAAGAVLLSQPAAALVVAARRLKPASELLADVAADVGDLAWVEYDGSEPLSSEIGAADTETKLKTIIGERHALLLPGYGLLTWGKTLTQAIARAEAVDRWCEIALKFHDTHE